jgi:hypothetical protein
MVSTFEGTVEIDKHVGENPDVADFAFASLDLDQPVAGSAAYGSR